MQLHNDENRRADRVHRPASAGTNGTRNIAGPVPPARVKVPDFLEKGPGDACFLKRGDFSISLNASPGLRTEVGALIKRMYSWRGYETENVVVSSHNPNRLTLEATIGRRLVGTLTLGLDSDEGLSADELYFDEVNEFRREGRKLCELTKLAVDPQYSSKEILASLFHLAYIYGHRIHKATDLFIEVNPRHAGFYRRMLGLAQIGEERSCRRVQAPAVLMHLELDYVNAQISSLAGSCRSSEKSLYPYFFSKHEEKGLASRLQRHNS
jgi:hypothetical protein